LNVGKHTGRVRTLDPHQVPGEDVNTQLVAQGGLPRVHVGRKGIPLFSTPFWGMRKSVPPSVIVQSLPTSWMLNLLSKLIYG
jgi:hypothetical protein